MIAAITIAAVFFLWVLVASIWYTLAWKGELDPWPNAKHYGSLLLLVVGATIVLMALVTPASAQGGGTLQPGGPYKTKRIIYYVPYPNGPYHPR